VKCLLTEMCLKWLHQSQDPLTQSLGDTHKGSVCACVFIARVSISVYVHVYKCLWRLSCDLHRKKTGGVSFII